MPPPEQKAGMFIVPKGISLGSSDSCIAQSGKHLPAMQETWVQFMGWEVPLEKEMATLSSIPA